MKKLILFLALISCAFAAEYQLEEKAFTIGTDLEFNKGAKGVIEQRVLSYGMHFEIKGDFSAESAEKIFAWGTTYEVKNGGKLIATVEKQIMESMFTFMGNVYIIKDDKGNELARSELSKGLRPVIIVKEKNGAVTTMKASGWRYITWDIYAPRESKLDPRILFIICASKTTGDNKK